MLETSGPSVTAPALADVLARLEVRAQIFHNGVLCETVAFPAEPGVGHLHLLRHGRLRVESAQAPALDLLAPALVFYPRPLPHRFVQAAVDGADLVCSHLRFGGAAGLPLVRSLPAVLALPLGADGPLHTALTLLFAEADAVRQVPEGRHALLNRLSEVVVLLLLRVLEPEHRAGLLAGLADARLAKALHAVHEQPALRWTLADAAACAGMSRARFAAHFRQVLGQTWGDYLSAWRVSLAQALLERGGSAKQAALEAGYASASGLARAFASQRLPPPKQWARQRDVAAAGPSTDNRAPC